MDIVQATFLRLAFVSFGMAFYGALCPVLGLTNGIGMVLAIFTFVALALAAPYAIRATSTISRQGENDYSDFFNRSQQRNRITLGIGIMFQTIRNGQMTSRAVWVAV